MNELAESIRLYTEIMVGARNYTLSIADILTIDGRIQLDQNTINWLISISIAIFEEYIGRLPNEAELRFMTDPLGI